VEELTKVHCVCAYHFCEIYEDVFNRVLCATTFAGIFIVCIGQLVFGYLRKIGSQEKTPVIGTFISCAIVNACAVLEPQ
jgi:hypothetical protein